ncbi:antiterminator LoaP [Bacillus sp. FJAT-26377]|nr:antiterminator LoaP [Bacillus sp. FJAT-26377]
MNWYALSVETGKEEIVQKFLRVHFDKSTLHSFSPKRKIPEKKAGKVYNALRTIFPGYVLIRTNMTPDIFYKIKEIPNCYKMVNNGDVYSKERGVYYSKIEDEEIDPIIKLINPEGIIEYSKIYAANSKVLVKGGPLKGMEAIIKKVDKHKNRAKILLNFMGKERLIDVGIITLIEP